MLIHILSPILYVLFVKISSSIKPVPNSKTMLIMRKYHNIIL